MASCGARIEATSNSSPNRSGSHTQFGRTYGAKIGLTKTLQMNSRGIKEFEQQALHFINNPTAAGANEAYSGCNRNSAITAVRTQLLG